jgi:hypothetical protein
MTNPPRPKSRPGLRQRQAVALRENLKRRKAQARSRASAAGKEAPDERRADKAKEKA